MKPVRLTMKAFGSYAEETCVPFDTLNQGLYLITGDTGAGKTTIFDAIVFALFGEASGTSRKRSMLHSDFVSKGEDTVVTLEFEHAGTACVVTRTIHFIKKRGTAGEYGDAKIDAVLLEGDKSPIKGDTKVSGRITALLGMDAEQFRKIVMLAQGEFDRFLRADSKEKNQILGKLFDNRPYVRFQSLLKKAAEQIARERKAEKDKLGYALSPEGHFCMPEGLTDAEREGYRPEHPQLEENLTALVEQDQSRVAALETVRQERSKAQQMLLKEQAVAKVQNQKLEDLAAAKTAAKALREQAPAMDVLREQAALAGRALHQVAPSERTLEDKLTERRRNDSLIAQLKELLGKQTETLARCDAAVLASGPKQNEISVLTTQIDTIARSLGEYEALNGLCRRAQEAEKRAQQEKRAREKAEEQQWKVKNALARLSQELEGLDGIDAIVEQKGQQYREAAERWNAIAGDGGLCSRVDALKQDEQALNVQKNKLFAQQRLAMQANARHAQLYQDCIAGQAGILAVDLQRRLKQEGEALCPVCHTLHRVEEGHEFALPAAQTPTWEDVNQAKKCFDKEEQKRQRLDSETERMEHQLTWNRSNAVDTASELLSAALTWEQLTEPGYLERAVSAEQEKLQRAKDAYNDAADKQQRQKQLREQEVAQRQECERLEGEVKERERKESHWNSEAKACNAQIEEKQQHLSYTSKVAAQQVQMELEQQRVALEQQIKAAQEAQAKAKAGWDTTSGRLSNAKEQQDALNRAVDAARQGLEEALSLSGFENLAAVHAALAPIGGEDGERWLDQQSKTLADYAQRLARTEERLAGLQDETRDYDYTDLAALQEKLDAADAALQQADTEQKRAEKHWENHTAALKIVQEVNEKLKKTEGAASRISLLSEMSNATLSFDRYVLGSAFKEILAAANTRLSEMSGGKYELIHQMETSRRNSAAGLDIEVLDLVTGKQRKSESLSGGESFQVSMSLALGLSDVVQNHAGGRPIDAMFIDEGFGSLDDHVLDKAISVLDELAGGSRQVGIISHVAKLEECIPQKICVRGSSRGSSIQIVG